VIHQNCSTALVEANLCGLAHSTGIFRVGLRVWLSECYQYKSHSALGEKQSPEAAFRSDDKALRFVSTEELAQAFSHCETRKLDKSGCISFMGKKYEVGLSFVGCRVDVVYDPSDITEVTIEYGGHRPWTARELVIGEHAGKRPTMPNHLGQQSVEHSRLLDAATEQYAARKDVQKTAVSYRRIKKEGALHV
jgi:hypothetical protein